MLDSFCFALQSAVVACRYASHSLRDTFDVSKLDLLAVARSFGFATPPLVPLALEASKVGVVVVVVVVVVVY